MKNITVFSILVTICLLTVFPVFGQDGFLDNYSVSISPQFGFVYGQTLELVYQDPQYNSHEFLSKLKYDMKPVFYGGIQIELEKKDIMSAAGFFSLVSFKAGLPGDSGIHENRDWMSSENTNLTHFSRHTNKTHDFYILDAMIGMSIPVKSILYITPFISGSWMHFSFSGRDGYGKYAREKTSKIYYPIDDNPINIPWNGTVITYKQDWVLAAVGFTAGTKILHPFTIDLSFKISPFTYCAAEDRHLTTNNTYNDYTDFGLYIEPGLAVSYSWKKFDFCLDFNYRYIGQTKGITYINNSLYPASNDSGAGLNMLDTRFLVKFKI